MIDLMIPFFSFINDSIIHLFILIDYYDIFNVTTPTNKHKYTTNIDIRLYETKQTTKKYPK